MTEAMISDGGLVLARFQKLKYGKAIKIVRTAHGFTQRELADRLSVGPSQISLIEAGKRRPSLDVLDEIAAVLRVPPHLLTVLATEPKDIDTRIDPRQWTELAKSLLKLLVASGERPTRPRTKPTTRTKRRKRRKLTRAV